MKEGKRNNEHTKTNLQFIFCVTNVAVATVTSTAMVAVTSDGKADFHCNSGSDRQWQR